MAEIDDCLGELVKSVGLDVNGQFDGAAESEEFVQVPGGDIGDSGKFFFHPEVTAIIDVHEGVLICAFLGDCIDDEDAARLEEIEGVDDRFPGGSGVDDRLKWRWGSFVGWGDGAGTGIASEST